MELDYFSFSCNYLLQCCYYLIVLLQHNVQFCEKILV